MSFSSISKAEICKTPINRKCCAIAECYGILLFCNTFSDREIRIITESRPFIGRLSKLFKKAFGFAFDQIPEDTEKTGKLTLIINSAQKITSIFTTYGYGNENLLAHHINLGVLEDECCKLNFIRGAFLAGGSVTNPEKRYHLELVTDHYNVSLESFSLLLELGFDPKYTSRNGNYITYFKQSEAIEDFLTAVGAPIAAMGIMSAKIEKDMRNSVNRRVNCDTANVSKIVDAAQQQIDAIRKIENAFGIESLPDKLKETAMMRIENPEMSLTELASVSVPPVTKSCLNHRLRKLTELSKSIVKSL